MDLGKPLAVLTPTVDGDVLAALAGADAAFTPGEMHRLIGEHSESGVRKALARLVRQGIVVHQRMGNAYVYRLNREHLAAPAVIQLTQQFPLLLRRLSEHFETWAVAPVYAVMFGSAARATMHVDSDIDVFVVRPDSVEVDGRGWLDAVHSLAADATGWTGNDVRVLEMSEAEVRAGVEARNPLLEEIRRDGIALWGDPRVVPAARRQGRVRG